MWRLRCLECNREWILPVSFDLNSMGTIYYYCRYCKRNTFHKVIEKIEEYDVARID